MKYNLFVKQMMSEALYLYALEPILFVARLAKGPFIGKLLSGSRKSRQPPIPPFQKSL